MSTSFYPFAISTYGRFFDKEKNLSMINQNPDSSDLIDFDFDHEKRIKWTKCIKESVMIAVPIKKYSKKKVHLIGVAMKSYFSNHIFSYHLFLTVYKGM